MKGRTVLLALAAAAVVVTVLAMGGRETEKKVADAPPPVAAGAPAQADRTVAQRPTNPQGSTWQLSPRPSDAAATTGGAPGAGANAGGPGSAPGVPSPSGTAAPPATLSDRIAALARQVDSGSGGDPFELYSMLDECATAPQRMAITTGCVSGGDCGPASQRIAAYQDTLAACQQVSPALVAGRQRYLDLAASRGDSRAQAARQQPR